MSSRKRGRERLISWRNPFKAFPLTPSTSKRSSSLAVNKNTNCALFSGYENGTRVLRAIQIRSNSSRCKEALTETRLIPGPSSWRSTNFLDASNIRQYSLDCHTHNTKGKGEGLRTLSHLQTSGGFKIIVSGGKEAITARPGNKDRQLRMDEQVAKKSTIRRHSLRARLIAVSIMARVAGLPFLDKKEKKVDPGGAGPLGNEPKGESQSNNETKEENFQLTPSAFACNSTVAPRMSAATSTTPCPTRHPDLVLHSARWGMRRDPSGPWHLAARK